MANPTNRYRKIDVGRSLYETLRAYYSVNKAGKLSWLYKYCAAILQPLVAPLAQYDVQRLYDGLIANSKFQIGQLTNVLNYLYDNTLNRIFITQGAYNQVVDTCFGETPIHWDDVFANSPLIFEVEFNDPIPFIGTIIHVPVSANLSELTATVAQMALEGVSYTIVTF